MMNIRLKCEKGLNYPLFDSLSDNAQKLYLFMKTQDGHLIDVDAFASILHLTMKELCEAVLELWAKKTERMAEGKNEL